MSGFQIVIKIRMNRIGINFEKFKNTPGPSYIHQSLIIFFMYTENLFNRMYNNPKI